MVPNSIQGNVQPELGIVQNISHRVNLLPEWKFMDQSRTCVIFRIHRTDHQQSTAWWLPDGCVFHQSILQTDAAADSMLARFRRCGQGVVQHFEMDIGEFHRGHCGHDLLSGNWPVRPAAGLGPSAQRPQHSRDWREQSRLGAKDLRVQVVQEHRRADQRVLKGVQFVDTPQTAQNIRLPGVRVDDLRPAWLRPWGPES